MCIATLFHNARHTVPNSENNQFKEITKLIRLRKKYIINFNVYYRYRRKKLYVKFYQKSSINVSELNIEKSFIIWLFIFSFMIYHMLIRKLKSFFNYRKNNYKLAGYELDRKITGIIKYINSIRTYVYGVSILLSNLIICIFLWERDNFYVTQCFEMSFNHLLAFPQTLSTDQNRTIQKAINVN